MNLPDRDYPFANDLREGLNRSRRRLDLVNLVQLVLTVLAIVLTVLAIVLTVITLCL